MTDTCTITRATASTTNTTTGAVTPTTTQVYAGVCRIQQSNRGANSATRDSGPAVVLIVVSELHLPVAASAGIRAGDIATITASVNDADLVGRRLSISAESAKTDATARRFGVEEVTG